MSLDRDLRIGARAGCVWVVLLMALFGGSAHAHNLTGVLHDRDVLVRLGLPTDAGVDPFLLRYMQVTGTGPTPDGMTNVLGQFGASQNGQKEGVWLNNSLWAQDEKLSICFFDGSSDQKARASAIFNDILTHTNLSAMYSATPCPVKGVDIQVKFATGDECSAYYGKQGLGVIAKDANEPTVNLCNVHSPWSPDEDGVITHEFMHALGAVHEHQHPDSKCDQEFDYNYLKNYVAEGDTDAKKEQWLTTNFRPITASYPAKYISTTAWDRSSVMYYQLPSKYFLDPAHATCELNHRNNKLSAGDIQMLSLMYPTGK